VGGSGAAPFVYAIAPPIPAEPRIDPADMETFLPHGEDLIATVEAREPGLIERPTGLGGTMLFIGVPLSLPLCKLHQD